MDTRRTTLIASIVLIALLAVGIGYAYTAYTENAGNNTDISYVTLTQTGTTGYTFGADVDVEMDTYNETNTSTVYYRLNGSQILKNGSDEYALKTLGSITLHAVMTGGDTHPNLTVSVAGSTNFDATSNWFYIIGSEPNANSEIEIYAIKNSSKATSSWTAGPDAWTMAYSGSAYADKKINVYYGYDAKNNTITKAGLDYMKVSEMPKNLDNASLLFMASNDVQDKIVYHSGDNEYTVYNTKTTPRTYSLTSSPEKLGFTIPSGKTFSGWSLTPGGAIVTTVTIEDPATSINVYAVYADA